MSSLSALGRLRPDAPRRPAAAFVPPLAGLGRAGSRWVVPLLLLALWHAASTAALLPVQVLPPPALVLATLLELLRDGTIADNLRISFHRIAVGLAIGGSAGLLAGVLLGLSDSLDRLFGPFFRAVAQIPSIGWLPPLFILLGVGETLKYVLIAKACFVPILLNTSGGIRAVPGDLREVAAALRLPRRVLLRRLVFPASWPAIFTGIRLAVSHAWVALVLVEMLAAAEGVGYMMAWGRTLFQTDVVIAGMIVIGLIGFAIDCTLKAVERRLRKGEASPSPARPRRSDGNWQGIIVPGLLLLLWIAASHFGAADPRLLVPIERLLALPFADEYGAHLWAGLGASLLRMLAGFSIGTICGLALGLAMAASPGVERLLGPSVHALRQITLFAWIPLLTAWFGASDQAKLVFVALAAFFPMVLNAGEALRNIPSTQREVVAVLCLPLSLRIRRLMLPAALPGIFIGLQLGLIYAWIGTVGAEYAIGLGRGLGTLMAEGRAQFRMDIVLLGVLTLASVGTLLGFVLRRAVAWAAPWSVGAG